MRKAKRIKDGGATTEQDFGIALEACGRQCQHEIRCGMHTGFARCPEKHLEKSKDPERKGVCQLTVVKMNKTTKLFCQWHAAALLRQIQYSPVPTKRPTVEDANQVGMALA